MNTRPIAAAFFVAFCLLLCGLILRRQIIAHPLPPVPPDAGRQSDGQGLWAGQNWRPAPSAVAKQVQEVVGAEIAALRGGEGAKAMSYGSQDRRDRFPDPSQYSQLMQEHHPEMDGSGAVRYGPVGVDPSGQNAWAVVLLTNRSGQLTRDNFLLAREHEGFRISRIQSQALSSQNRPN